MSRTAEIKLTIDLDDDSVPARILWEASEGHAAGPTPCQSMMLSLWDRERRDLAAIDLWIRDMTIDDMNLYFYQAIHRMADVFLRATKNGDGAKLMHEFGEEFGGFVGLTARHRGNGKPQDNSRIDLVSMAHDKRYRGAK